MDPRYDVLADAAALGRAYVDGLAARHVGATASVAELQARLARPLTQAGEDPRTVIAQLAADVDAGITASAGPRYFGFVIGGALPAAVAADWLTSAWDQNGGGTITTPGLAVVESVAAGWVRELLGLPAGCGIGFVTGCQMAHVTCLAAARHAVLAEAGQVLVRFAGDDDVTNDVIARVQADGTCWAGGSRWHGDAVMRISVSGWQTTVADADRSADAILAALRAATA